MPRRRSIIRVPFFKTKLNRYTVYNIFGLLIFFFGVISLISFYQPLINENQGKWLFLLKQIIEKFFGSFFAVYFSFLLILISSYFFKSKRSHLIKGNVTSGIIFIFFSLITISKSGIVGKTINNFLVERLSFLGVYLFSLTIFFIGLIVVFDFSLAEFITIIGKLLSETMDILNKIIFRKRDKFIEDKEILKKDEKFVEAPTKTKILTPKPISLTTFSPSQKDFSASIKPLTTASNSLWVYPPISLLTNVIQSEADRGDTRKNADGIERTLESFGIRAKIDEINEGPSVTQYAIKITMGTKLSRITALANDLALALAAPTGQVRIEAPIPGKSLVGIEIPNIKPEIVTLKKLLTSPLFTNSSDSLLVPLGLDVSGKPKAYSIKNMPHVLIAGTTGSGKSVLLNSWITTFLFRTRPDQLRLILVDPKRVELTLYNGIPHLLTEVIAEKEKIISALKYVVKEMDVRLKEFSQHGVRNLEEFNQLNSVQKKPYIIFIIDELADIMIFAPADVEDLITRIAQMARATGIHLILATQRPSVDVITGLMKANIPTRIAFNVSSMIDSRVIIDMPGAEKLLGKGDMLFLPPDQAKPIRIQGPYVTEKEVKQVVQFLKNQNPEIHYTEEVTQQDFVLSKTKSGTMVIGDYNDKDPLFDKAVEIIMQFDKASASLLQRRLSIGYARAARILDQLEKAGYVGPAEGSKPRDVIKRPLNQANE